MMNYLKRFLRRDDGSPTVEFVLAFPIMIILFFGIIDFTLYIMNQKKIQSLAANFSSVITRKNITSATLNTILSLAPTIAAPLPFSTKGKVIVTAVMNSSTLGYQVLWQRAGGGSGAGTSAFPASGSVAMPGSLTLPPGGTTVFTEVFYQIQTVFLRLVFPSLNLYERVVARPKTGSLLTLP